MGPAILIPIAMVAAFGTTVGIGIAVNGTPMYLTIEDNWLLDTNLVQLCKHGHMISMNQLYT